MKLKYGSTKIPQPVVQDIKTLQRGSLVQSARTIVQQFHTGQLLTGVIWNYLVLLNYSVPLNSFSSEIHLFGVIHDAYQNIIAEKEDFQKEFGTDSPDIALHAEQCRNTETSPL